MAYAGDATAAFLQGSLTYFQKERHTPLHMQQPREGLPNVPKGQGMPVKSNSQESNFRLVRGVHGLISEYIITAPRQWWLHFRDTMIKYGFVQSTLDPALFVLRNPNVTGVGPIASWRRRVGYMPMTSFSWRRTTQVCTWEYMSFQSAKRCSDLLGDHYSGWPTKRGQASQLQCH
eukprot:4011561-Amphidinium_carterae.2